MSEAKLPKRARESLGSRSATAAQSDLRLACEGSVRLPVFSRDLNEGVEGDALLGPSRGSASVVECLEPELKNQPQINDCGAFLEAVDPTRAMLIR